MPQNLSGNSITRLRCDLDDALTPYDLTPPLWQRLRVALSYYEQTRIRAINEMRRLQLLEIVTSTADELLLHLDAQAKAGALDGFDEFLRTALHHRRDVWGLDLVRHSLSKGKDPTDACRHRLELLTVYALHTSDIPLKTRRPPVVPNVLRVVLAEADRRDATRRLQHSHQYRRVTRAIRAVLALNEAPPNEDVERVAMMLLECER